MKIPTITTGIRILNFLINSLLILLLITGLAVIVGYITSFIDSAKLIYVFAGFLSILLLLYALYVIKSNLDKEIELNESEIVRLEINSKKKVDELSTKSEIKYLENYLITKTNKYEVDNQTAFEILNMDLNIVSVDKYKPVFLLNTSADDIFEKVRRILRFGVFLSGFK